MTFVKVHNKILSPAMNFKLDTGVFLIFLKVLFYSITSYREKFKNVHIRRHMKARGISSILNTLVCNKMRREPLKQELLKRTV